MAAVKSGFIPLRDGRDELSEDKVGSHLGRDSSHRAEWSGAGFVRPTPSGRRPHVLALLGFDVTCVGGIDAAWRRPPVTNPLFPSPPRCGVCAAGPSAALCQVENAAGKPRCFLASSFYFINMNPMKLINMDESMKGTSPRQPSPHPEPHSTAVDVVWICLKTVLTWTSSFFFVFSPAGLRFLRALRLIQFSEILQFLNILKTR